MLPDILGRVAPGDPGALLVSVRRQGFTTGCWRWTTKMCWPVERPSSNLMPTVRPELRVLRTTERPQRAASNSEAPRTDPRFRVAAVVPALAAPRDLDADANDGVAEG